MQGSRQGRGLRPEVVDELPCLHLPRSYVAEHPDHAFQAIMEDLFDPQVTLNACKVDGTAHLGRHMAAG